MGVYWSSVFLLIVPHLTALMSVFVSSDLQPPQRRAGWILHLIKQLVFSKREDRNQLSPVHTQTHTLSEQTLAPPPQSLALFRSSTHPCLRASLMKPFLFWTCKKNKREKSGVLLQNTLKAGCHMTGNPVYVFNFDFYQKSVSELLQSTGWMNKFKLRLISPQLG